MSQSQLAPSRSRKSLTAFSRPPSALRGGPHTPSPLPDSPSPLSREAKDTPPSPSKNAFATPPRQQETSSRRRIRHSVGVGVGSEPGTPANIVYAPYATPPAGLSRSTSIPFDMAACARANKEAEEDRLRVLSDAQPREKKKRLVRSKALWRRVLESPGNWWDSAVLTVPNSVDELLPPARWANPIALGMYVLHWLVLAPLLAGKKEEPDFVILKTRASASSVDDRWGRFEDEIKPQRRGLLGARSAILFTFILLALSTANAVYLFTRFRRYDMLLRSASDPVRSPHASPIPAPRTQVEDEPEREASPDESGSKKLARVAGHGALVSIKWLHRSTLSALGARAPASSAPSPNTIQSLQVWDPPDFCLAFFCAFPPSAPIIAYLLTTAHPFLIPVLHAISASLLSHVAASFAQLVRDRQILSAEVMREYDERFVYPRLFAPKVDRAVGTSDSIMNP